MKPRFLGRLNVENSNLRKLLIVEGNPTGHRLLFARLLLEYVRNSGKECIFITTDAAASSAIFKQELSQVLEYRGISIQTTEIVEFSGVVESARSGGCNQIVIPDGDRWLMPAIRNWSSLKGMHLTLLLIHDPLWDLASLETVGVKAVLKQAVILFLRHIGRVNIKLLGPATESPSREHRINDPVVITESDDELLERASRNRARLRFDGERTWIGIVGNITPYKNIKLLADSVVLASKRTGAKFGVAILGPISPSYGEQVRDQLKVLQEEEIHVVVDDAQRTNSQVNVDVLSLDVVAVLYSVNCTNSTMAKAASLGVRTVCAGPPAFREIYRATTGELATTLAVDSVAQRIVEVVDSSKPFPVKPPELSQFAINLVAP